MKIRPFEADDAEAVASLWQYWFKDKTRVPQPGLVSLVRRIYVEDPNVDDEVRSLVAEDERGRMLGFLGVSVMPVEVDGREEKMAGIFPSVVAPDAPTSVATFLLRRFLQGPQAFTLSDGGHVKFERIWEALGGQIAQMQSLRWVKVLRPAQLGASAGAGRRGVRSLLPLLRPLARGADVAVRRVAARRFTAAPPARAGGSRSSTGEVPLVTEPLTPARLIEVTPALHGAARLRPLYDEAHVAWQFGEMARISEQGEFTARLVSTPQGEPVGWFVYYMKPGGVSRVFAIEAHERYLASVVDELIGDADRRGAGALMGRMEPRLRRVIAQRTEFVYPRGSLQMVHSKDATLMQDAQLGRLAYSRLQGENWYWWALDSNVLG